MRSYPTAYRAGSGKYGSAAPAEKAFQLPQPYQPPTRPPSANDNIPKPANDNTRKARQLARSLRRYSKAGRLILRNAGYVGRLFDALELLESPVFRNDGVIPPSGLGATVCQTCPQPAAQYWGSWGSLTLPCGSPIVCFTSSGVTGAVPVTAPPPAAELPFSSFRTFIVTGYNITGTPRYALVQLFRGPAQTSARPLTYHARRFQPSLPVIDPFLLPISKPMQLPSPRPVNPNKPTDWREFGPSPKPRISVRRPPPPGSKEVKTQGRAMNAFIRAAQSLAHDATEVNDFIDAMHRALPEEFRAQAHYSQGRWWNASPVQKAKAVWTNIEHLDWTKAAMNLAVNEVTDRALGRAQGKADEFMNNTPIGRINTGLVF